MSKYLKIIIFIIMILTMLSALMLKPYKIKKSKYEYLDKENKIGKSNNCYISNSIPYCKNNGYVFEVKEIYIVK